MQDMALGTSIMESRRARRNMDHGARRCAPLQGWCHHSLDGAVASTLGWKPRRAVVQNIRSI